IGLSRRLPRVRRSECLESLKNDLEQFNALPFSRVVGIDHIKRSVSRCARSERCILYPNPVTSRRPRIEHLKRVTASTKSFRKCSLNSWPCGDRRRRVDCAHRCLRTERCAEFLCRNRRNQRGKDCDHRCLHVSLSFEAYEHVAHNHACTQYIFRWILLKRPHAFSI